MKKIGLTVTVSLLFIVGVIMIFNMPNKEQISAKTYKEQILSHMSQLKEVKLSDDVVLTSEDFQLNMLTNLDDATQNIKDVKEVYHTVMYLSDINEVVEQLVKGESNESAEQDKSLNQTEDDVLVAIQNVLDATYLNEKPTLEIGDDVYKCSLILNEKLQAYKNLKTDTKKTSEKKLYESLDDVVRQYVKLLHVFYNQYYPSVYETLNRMGYEGVKPTPVDEKTLQVNVINYLSISERYFSQTEAFLEDAMAYLDLFNIIDEYEDLVTLTSGTGHFVYTKDLEALTAKVESIKNLNTSLSYDVQVKAERLQHTTLTYNPLLVEKLVLADVELKQYYTILNAAQSTADEQNLDQDLGQQFMILHGLMQSIYKDIENAKDGLFYDTTQQIVAVSNEL